MTRAEVFAVRPSQIIRAILLDPVLVQNLVLPGLDRLAVQDHRGAQGFTVMPSAAFNSAVAERLGYPGGKLSDQDPAAAGTETNGNWQKRE
jgi:hypothetical protein